MVTDAALMLWSKCKAVLDRAQSPVVSFPKCLGRIDNVGKVGTFLFVYLFIVTSYRHGILVGLVGPVWHTA